MSFFHWYSVAEVAILFIQSGDFGQFCAQFVDTFSDFRLRRIQHASSIGAIIQER